MEIAQIENAKNVTANAKVVIIYQQIVPPAPMVYILSPGILIPVHAASIVKEINILTLKKTSADFAIRTV